MTTRDEHAALVEHALELHASGVGAVEISRRCGKARTWWSMQKRALGLDVREMRPVTQEELHMIRALRVLGASYDIIDVALGRGAGWTGQSRSTMNDVREALESAEIEVAGDVDVRARGRAVGQSRVTRAEIRDRHAQMVDRAIEMIRSGSSRGDVARELGVSRAWVTMASKRSERLHDALTARVMMGSRAALERVASMLPLSEGVTTQQVSDALGVSRQRAHQILQGGVRRGWLDRDGTSPVVYRSRAGVATATAAPPTRT